MLATRGGGEGGMQIAGLVGWDRGLCKGPLPPFPHPGPSVSKSFYRGREGDTIVETIVGCDSILKLVLDGPTSIISIVLSTVNLQSQGQFVPISLRPILESVAANVLATV